MIECSRDKGAEESNENFTGTVAESADVEEGFGELIRKRQSCVAGEPSTDDK
jgi:hypothetical protein